MAVNPIVDAQGSVTLADAFSPGSALTQPNPVNIPTPHRMSTVSGSAKINMAQNESETKKIGVPGTTYSNNIEDDIIHTSGGHTIALGNAPGEETVVIQAKSGARIELSSDSSIKLVGDKGLHIAIGSDMQVVLHGDFLVTTNGDFRVKCSSYIVDCHDYVVTASGSKRENIQGDHNSTITGDSHSTVNGDVSKTYGGDHRETIAGNSKSQVVGDRRVHTKGEHESSSNGHMKLETNGDMNHVSKGNMKHGSMKKMIHKAKDDYSCDTGGKHTSRSKKTMSQHSEADIQQNAATGHTINSQQSITQTAATSHNITAGTSVSSAAGTTETRSALQSQTLNSGQGTTISSGKPSDGQGGMISLQTSGTIKTSAAAAKSTTHPSTAQDLQSMIPLPNIGTPKAPDDTQANVVPPDPQIPDATTIHKNTGDILFTNGEIIQLANEEHVYMSYDDDDGGGPPQAVLDRMKEHGMNYDVYKQQQQNPNAGQTDESPAYDMSEKNISKYYPKG